MRYGPTDRFWVVTDPTPESELGDILFEASLADLERQFRGGLKMESHPTIFTEKGEAENEAQARLVARNVTQALRQEKGKASILHAKQVRLVDEGGKVIFEADVRR